MTTMEPAPRQVAVKVSPEGDRLITSGAHYLRMSKKDLVEAAVVFYLNARREEMQAGMRELLSQLDGSRAARVALLAGMTREELEAAGARGRTANDAQASKAHAAVPVRGG
jgi:type IV pilus biogenesis protein CpaD/CtpE